VKKPEPVGKVEIQDSRRLTGPSLLLARPGAILDVACPEEDLPDLIRRWEEEVRRALGAVGWAEEELATRSFPGGASLAMTAPADALYAATEVNEWAFLAARSRLRGGGAPDLTAAAERLRREIADEVDPALLGLRDEAERRGVLFLADGERVTVGSGVGSRTFDADDLPAPEDVDWGTVHDVPLAVVTGTNGKSTTDGVVVGGETVEEGDYSGPEGARRVLRDERVETAILETARGGLLRRGLAVTRADAALVTNVSEDHLAEWGVTDLGTLVRAKLVVHRVVPPDGRLVLNAEDPELVLRAAAIDRPLAWFALDGANGTVRRHVDRGGDAAWLDGDTLVLARDGGAEAVLAASEVPIALGGAARYNVANALAALLVGSRLGFDTGALAEGLRRFTGSAAENPGRGNVFDLGGVRAIVDFAHNPHGCRALLSMAAALPAERRLVVLGQAGDRTDDAIRELARIVWRARPDRIVLKEMAEDLRGREPGEVPALFEGEFRRLGVPSGTVTRAASEIEAVREALRWAKPGDLLLLLSHIERGAVLDLVERLLREGWRPGGEL